MVERDVSSEHPGSASRGHPNTMLLGGKHGMQIESPSNVMLPSHHAGHLHGASAVRIAVKDLP